MYLCGKSKKKVINRNVNTYFKGFKFISFFNHYYSNQQYMYYFLYCILCYRSKSI